MDSSPYRWMNGDCVSWAIAAWRSNPRLGFLIEYYYDEEVCAPLISHVRVHDGEYAWDALGWEPLGEVVLNQQNLALWVSFEDLLLECEAITRLLGTAMFSDKDIKEADLWTKSFYDFGVRRENPAESTFV